MSTAALPTYRASKPCPKCGNAFVSTTYRTTFRVLWRECQRCGYGWTEKPLDA